jgi:hypothetical protein
VPVLLGSLCLVAALAQQTVSLQLLIGDPDVCGIVQVLLVVAPDPPLLVLLQLLATALLLLVEVLRQLELAVFDLDDVVAEGGLDHIADLARLQGHCGLPELLGPLAVLLVAVQLPAVLGTGVHRVLLGELGEVGALPDLLQDAFSL